MARLLAVLTVIGTGASLGGLVATIQSAGWSPWIVSILVATLLYSLYVGFVPDSRVEKNVRNKLERYQSDDGREVTVQRGTFQLEGLGSVSIEFNPPFAEPPLVEVINDQGNRGALPEILNVTQHQAEIGRTFSAPGERQTFTWVARGIALRRIE